jgi:hypothetical protein
MTVTINTELQRPKWRKVVLVTLAFWLSSSLVLDLVIMPSLYAAGMMAEPGFTTAGYSIFWLFNRIELVCAAIVLTGVLILKTAQNPLAQSNKWAMPLSLGLLAIALIYTYGLTPEMSALGTNLNLFASTSDVPAAMNQMHEEYWFLELVKLAVCGTLISFCNKQAHTE